MNDEVIVFKNPSYDLEVRISISGYQYPEMKTGHDSNWLFVDVECYCGGDEFKRRHPSLMVSDLGAINAWFQTISENGIPRWTRLGFTEPNIEFELFRNDDGTIRFGIRLSNKSKPPFWIPGLIADGSDPEDEFIAVFECTFEQMAGYARRFSKLCDMYPARWQRN